MSHIRAKTTIKILTDDGNSLDYTFVSGTHISEVVNSINAGNNEALKQEFINEIKVKSYEFNDGFVDYVVDYDDIVEAINKVMK